MNDSETTQTIGNPSSCDDIRAAGWSVSGHNDYQKDGKRHTYWSFARKVYGQAIGQEVHGEGLTDAEALNHVRTALHLPNLPAKPLPPPAPVSRFSTLEEFFDWMGLEQEPSSRIYLAEKFLTAEGYTDHVTVREPDRFPVNHVDMLYRGGLAMESHNTDRCYWQLLYLLITSIKAQQDKAGKM